jgi:hypothetical protein
MVISSARRERLAGVAANATTLFHLDSTIALFPCGIKQKNWRPMKNGPAPCGTGPFQTLQDELAASQHLQAACQAVAAAGIGGNGNSRHGQQRNGGNDFDEFRFHGDSK